MCVLSPRSGRSAYPSVGRGKAANKGIVPCMYFVCLRACAFGCERKAQEGRFGGRQAERVVCRIKHAHKWSIASSFWSSEDSCIPKLFERTTRVILKPLLVARLALRTAKS